MKKIIALILMATIVGGMLGLSLAKDKSSPAVIKSSNVEEKTYAKTNMDSWCPVAGDGRTASNEYHMVRAENGVEIYQHCQKCLTGVITGHEDGDARCTFCGSK